MIEEKIYFEDLKGILKSCAINLKNHVENINELNVFPVPDGDTGTNMNMTFTSALKAANESQSTNINSYLESFSKGSLLGARGNSGVILSQLIRGFVEALPENLEYIDIKTMVRAMENSSKVAYNAVMKPTEGTILTVSKDIAKSANKNKNNNNFLEFFNNICTSANKSLNNTPNLLAVLKESGVVDAGGKGLVVLYEGLLKYIKGDININSKEIASGLKFSEAKKNIEEDIEFGYCTEFIILMEEENNKVESELKDYLSNIGDSLMVVASGDIVKVHVHTYEPNKAMEKALSYGELDQISIDNMKYQHIETMFHEKEKNEIDKIVDNKKFGIITVSNGEGFEEIFNSLKVDKIISGGQTMNPSTEELLSAVESINAENIIILPNNSNIILSAQQVIDMTEKNVYVIPSKSIPQGINAILSFNESLSAEEVVNNMNESISKVKSAETTLAIRDTKINNRQISKGEIIGISNKDILSIGSDPLEVTIDLIENLIDLENDTFISIYYGKDTEKDQAESLLSKLEEAYEDVDIQLLYGGQPLYYYIISIE